MGRSKGSPKSAGGTPGAANTPPRTRHRPALNDPVEGDDPPLDDPGKEARKKAPPKSVVLSPPREEKPAAPLEKPPDANSSTSRNTNEGPANGNKPRGELPYPENPKPRDPPPAAQQQQLTTDQIAAAEKLGEVFQTRTNNRLDPTVVKKITQYKGTCTTNSFPK